VPPPPCKPSPSNSPKRDNALALELVQPDRQLERPAAPTSLDQRITAVLAERRQPRPFAELRTSCRIRTTTLYQRLAAMIADGIVVKSADGYSLSAH
jgi:DNA-binding HxlR family transcriptional regulator